MINIKIKNNNDININKNEKYDEPKPLVWN